MPTEKVQSWGRLTDRQYSVVRPAFSQELISATRSGSAELLCFGLGRSYGDVCLNTDGRMIGTAGLDHFLSADWSRGIIRAEAGMSLDALLTVCVPRGWFLPVSPGTKFVTLGGAVANDIHGKNHETAGTIGCHVRRLALVRSDNKVAELSPDQNGELFTATIGGLGLTGVILWVELQLVPIRSADVISETLPMPDLDAFFRISADSENWEYTVAWVDCLARGAKIGRGLYMRGRHADSGELKVHAGPRLSVPFDAPSFLLNSVTIGAFNALYRWQPWQFGARTVHYDTFFYPLDAIGQWNRLYGRRGFFQHQCAVPAAAAPATIRRLLELTAEFGEGSFLVVLKRLGDRASPGILSFPLSGVTLALDFPNKGESTRRLLARMSDIVCEAGGRLYPAKDATMSAEHFRAGYPHWRRLETLRDPGMISDFWRRVTRETA